VLRIDLLSLEFLTGVQSAGEEEIVVRLHGVFFQLSRQFRGKLGLSVRIDATGNEAFAHKLLSPGLSRDTLADSFLELLGLLLDRVAVLFLRRLNLADMVVVNRIQQLAQGEVVQALP
jgi:hypothetical protein